ncbi:hypothetical protein [Pseudomonas serbica]|jgi:hypothetical protein
MLTTILVLETTPLPKHGYLIRYIRATQDRQYKATISQKLYHSYQIYRGSTFQAEITTPFSLSAQIVSLFTLPLPIEFYPAALNICCKDIPMLDDRAQTLRKLKSLSRFPQRLSRYLDAASPDLLETVVGFQNAYKIHYSWSQRITLGLMHGFQRSRNMCISFCGSITKGSITLPQKTLQLLLHKRHQEISILTKAEICNNLNIDLPSLMEALNTLALYRTIIIHRDYVMLTGEFFLQNAIRSHLHSKFSDIHGATFFSYEIDNALERILLLLRASIHTSYRMMIQNCINFKINCICGLQLSRLRTIIPILSSVNDQLLGANFLVITPSNFAYNGLLPAEVKTISIQQLHRYASVLVPSNTLVLALDSDTYSNADLYVLLGYLTSTARLILHSSQPNHNDIYFGKLFYVLISQNPITTIPSTARALSNSKDLHTTFNSSEVLFDQTLEDIVRLIVSSNAVGCTPTYGQAKKLNRLLQKRIAASSNLLIDFNRFHFYSFDRFIFLDSLPDCKISKFSYGTILDATDSTVIIKIENTTTSMSFSDFIALKPELAYFLPMRYLKRLYIDEAIILTGPTRELVPYVTRAISRSKSYKIVYMRNFRITSEQLLPFSERKVMNIIPSVM